MRGILLIVRRSLRQHLFSTTITVLSIALASGLTMSVFSIQSQSREAFTGGDLGFDAVVGARGSQLQLVLNTVFHLETSPGNIPWTLYTELRDKYPGVELAIPYATGDNYMGNRIVGSTPEIFTKFEYKKGRKYAILEGGRPFDEGYAEAVIGSVVSEQTGLKLGDTFNPFHGIYFDPNARHPEEYTVVGIMDTTNTPSDRVIWIPIEGIFRMTGHVLRGTGEQFTADAVAAIPDAHKEVSAVMLKLKSPQVGWQLDQMINKQGKVATLAHPIGTVMLDLFNKVGWVNRILELVAYLVVFVSAAAITASIYNTINERKREFAILRALGARRRTVFSAIVVESACIAALGSLCGFVCYGAILLVAAQVVRQQTGVVLNATTLHPSLYLTPLGMVLLGALSGVIPAIRAYSTDVAENLAPHS
ncbi:MAG: ABC transporter permease [Candidatus Hydrogenedentes bacterium]|nr:ABC transporter permease [Candidatus Hydrogenedentota bacterium]